MFFPLTLIPVFQDYEVGSGITLLSATHNGKAGYADVILYFGIGVEQSVYFGVRIENLIYLLSYGLGALQARCRWKLHNSEEISVVFFRYESRGPLNEQQHSDYGKCSV